MIRLLTILAIMTLTDDDVGKWIQLLVQFRDDGNNQETRTGPATSAIVTAPRLLVGNLGAFLNADSSDDRSTGFVTGTHPLGYATDSITMIRPHYQLPGQLLHLGIEPERTDGLWSDPCQNTKSEDREKRD